MSGLHHRPGFIVLCYLITLASISIPAVLADGGVPPEELQEWTRMTAAERGAFYEAMEFFQAGQYEDARRVLSSMIEKDPESYQVQYLYSATLVQLKAYRQAATVFEWLIDRNPEDYRVLNNYGWMLATADDSGFRDPVRALTLAQQAILHAPAHSSIWNTLAEAHYVNANFDRAVKAMEHALDLAAREPASQSKIPGYQDQLGKMARAAELIKLLE